MYASGDFQRIDPLLFKGKAEQLRLVSDKSVVKGKVVADEHLVPAEIQKSGNHLLLRRRVLKHLIGDSGDLRDPLRHRL